MSSRVRRPGTPAVPTARYISSPLHRALFEPVDGASPVDVSDRIASVITAGGRIPIEEAAEGRYGIRLGRPSRPVAFIVGEDNEALANEHALRAEWAVVRAYRPIEGQVHLLIQRVQPRHGLASTYSMHGCRCADCTAANTQAARARAQRIAKPRISVPPKHGAAMYNSGCRCEICTAAVRDRKRRQRLREREQRDSDATAR